MVPARRAQWDTGQPGPALRAGAAVRGPGRPRCRATTPADAAADWPMVVPGLAATPPNTNGVISWPPRR